MSGFVRNDWGQYLNGGSSHYNFEYRSRAPSEPTPAPTPAPTPTPTPMPKTLPNTSHPTKNNKEGRVVIPTHKGGKRKSFRKRRSHKRSNKKYRRTHRK